MDNRTRTAALKALTVEASGRDADLSTSEAAFARRLVRSLGRPLHLISSSEYTEERALAVIDYAQSKLQEAWRLTDQAKAKQKGRR